MAKAKFTLFDIKALKNKIDSASIRYDHVADFLNTFEFDSVYETEDDSIVFDAGGENKIEIEFFDFAFPWKRNASVMYWENGKPVILNL